VSGRRDATDAGTRAFDIDSASYELLHFGDERAEVGTGENKLSQGEHVLNVLSGSTHAILQGRTNLSIATTEQSNSSLLSNIFSHGQAPGTLPMANHPTSQAQVPNESLNKFITIPLPHHFGKDSTQLAQVAYKRFSGGR
jgi:hypothetical protein